MTITVLISVTSHMAIIGIYVCLLLPPIPFTSASTSAGCGSFFCEVTQTFIPKGCGLLIILPELGCCSVPLTLIIGHGNSRTHQKGSPIFQT